MPNLITAADPVNIRPPASTFVLHQLRLDLAAPILSIVIIEADSKGIPVKGGIQLSVALEGPAVQAGVDVLNVPSQSTFVERLVGLFIAQRKLAPGSTVETV